MKPDRKLIEKFLANRCTDAEAEAVQAYFREHPAELDDHMPLDEWLTDSKMQLELSVSERILKGVRKKYGFRIVPLIRLAVAASFIGVLVFAGVTFLSRNERQGNVKQATVTKITRSTPKPETIENNTRQVMEVRLSDNSLVTLYPNSALQYLPLFEGSKRDVYLKGKARFKVSKDISRPFTVYAAGISTTALGTAFLVAVKDDKQVSVTLLEGSVRVASQRKADKNQFVVLRPGDKLVVSSGQFLHYTLSNIAGKSQTNSEVKSAPGNKPAKEGNELTFKNEPLKNVLKRIEEKFAVTINYEHAPQLEEKLFTGTFLETDDLEFIIKMISHLHNLKYTMEEKHVTLSMQ